MRRGVWWAAVAAAVALLGPALGPGYTLTYDMVFVPRQDLLPAAVGLGDVLPRAVPQDAVLAVLTLLLPGTVWQHLMLVGVVLGSVLGVAHLLRRSPAWQQAMGGLLYAWSAYVVERLVLGSWPLLVAYAALPWAVAAALGVRRHHSGGLSRLLLLVALSSLAPTGGLLATAVAVPIAVGPGSRAPRRDRAALVLGSAALQLPWLVPAITNPAWVVADPAGTEAFALRAEGPWGAVLTALGTGGVWNGAVVPSSRAWGLGLVGTLIVLVLAVAGGRRLRPVLGRSGAAWLTAVAVAGAAAAVVAALAPGPVSVVQEWLPGGGLFRDGQRWLAPLSLLLAVAAPLGAGRLLSRVGDRTARALLASALVALPALTLPDAAWGVSGRLAAVDYPEEWGVVRSTLQRSSHPGDVAVLPWGTFRTFAWNGGRTVLDPAPRWLPRPAVVDDTLLVRRRDGVVVAVAGESRRAAAVGAAVRAGTPLAPVLAAEGIGWVLVERGTPGEVAPGALAGLLPELTTPGLELLRVPGAGASPQPSAARVACVALAWAASLIVVALCGLAAIRRRFASRPARTGASVSPPSREEWT